MTCNNFSIGKKRYESIEAFKKSKNKPKQTRTAVGKFSPVTNTIRPPNGYGKEPKKELIICSNCNGALFTSQYDTKFLNLHDTFICLCDDNIKSKIETKYEEEEESKLSWGTKGDITPLDDNEVSYTEKPQFEDLCDGCSLPINYDIPIKIINKWEIDTCACVSSEEETDDDC